VDHHRQHEEGEAGPRPLVSPNHPATVRASSSDASRRPRRRR
jgi:hypothetical protein